MSDAIHDDYADHARDYRNFLWGLRVIVAGLSVLLLLLAAFLV